MHASKLVLSVLQPTCALCCLLLGVEGDQLRDVMAAACTSLDLLQVKQVLQAGRLKRSNTHTLASHVGFSCCPLPAAT